MTTAKTLGRVWASSPKDPIRDPGESKYSLGWVAEIPTYQVLNYLHNRIDSNILALAERGVFEWGADINYKKNALCWDETDGRIYIALVANPSKSAPPSQNLNQWTASSVQIPASRYQQLVDSVNAHLNDHNNPHKLTAAQLDAYTRAQIDALVANLQAELDAHEAAHNPHGTGAVDVGAVPVTGGRYTGVVYHDANIIGIGEDTNNAVQVAANKIFFKKGNLELGLDENGDPYFYDGTKQLLLNEELFLAVKQNEEAKYAVPAPDLVLNFMSDINTYVGTGPCCFESTGGLSYVNKEGVTKTNTVDEPRITQKGLAIRKGPEHCWVNRKYDGCGFTSFTDACEWYHVRAIDNIHSNIMWINGFTQNIFRVTNNSLEFIFWNGNGFQAKTLVNDLSEGRHIVACTWDGVSNTLSAYVDGLLLWRVGTAVPARTGWDVTDFVAGGAKSYDVYLQRFRSWAVCLTDKQVSTL